MNLNKLKGTGVALVTPFHKDTSIDFKSFQKLINRCIDGKVEYLVPLGTTGESATLTLNERRVQSSHRSSAFRIQRLRRAWVAQFGFVFDITLVCCQIPLSNADHGINTVRLNHPSHHKVAVALESFDFALSKLRRNGCDICHSWGQQTA